MGTAWRYDAYVGSLRKTLKWSAVAVAVLIAAGAARFLWLYETTPIKPRSGCPLIARFLPIDRSEILPTDYIDLREESAGPYSWEPIHIRVYGSGVVERDTVETVRGETFGCPLHAADRTLQVSPAAAKELLIRARDEGFCRLCAKYQFPGQIQDAGSEELELSLHGKSKSVWDHVGNPPPLFGELIEAIWAISPMERFADPSRFTPDREAECRHFEDEQVRLRQQQHP